MKAIPSAAGAQRVERRTPWNANPAAQINEYICCKNMLRPCKNVPGKYFTFSVYVTSLFYNIASHAYNYYKNHIGTMKTDLVYVSLLYQFVVILFSTERYYFL